MIRFCQQTRYRWLVSKISLPERSVSVFSGYEDTVTAVNSEHQCWVGASLPYAQGPEVMLHMAMLMSHIWSPVLVPEIPIQKISYFTSLTYNQLRTWELTFKTGSCVQSVVEAKASVHVLRLGWGVLDLMKSMKFAALFGWSAPQQWAGRCFYWLYNSSSP